ncbi:MAG TPA: efflux RND transporter periplasmic adaptor subunit [Gemmatimonadales bacterium]|jgi:cobalt-zinc-cadmium efflux system membrane fusion protein|nr:efflux RND transporter periplasmic adaptor subunit [Gemmatimonadales bacterium]
MTRIHPALLLALLVLPALACSDSPGDAAVDTTAVRSDSLRLVVTPAQRQRLDLIAVESTSYRPVIEVTGTVAFDGDQATTVLSPVSGPVTRVLVQPGDRVSRGQPLAYVTSPDFAAAVADFRKAAAAERNLSRIARLDSALFANDALARRELEQAETDALAAHADREAALAQLRALGVDQATLARLDAGQDVSVVEAAIRAPLAGTVVERLVSPGQLLEAGATSAFTVANLSRMWVMASVFESDLPSVRSGDAALVRLTNLPDTMMGRVDNIAAEVDPETRATSVRIVVPNPGNLLKKDMYVRVTLRSRRQRAGMLVPVSAVLRDDDNRPIVYVAADSLGFERRSITLGTRQDSTYEVTDGLQPGDRVVTEGGLFLQFAESQ